LKRKFRLWGGKEKPTFGEGRRGGIPALVPCRDGGAKMAKVVVVTMTY